MLNQVLIMGKVAREPKVTQNAMFFTVKTSETYKDREGQTKWDNQYHNVTMFGQSAARLARELQENAEVFVEGKLSTYKDKDGQYKTSILPRTVRVITGGRSNDDDMGGPNNPPSNSEEAYSEDIPF